LDRRRIEQTTLPTATTSRYLPEAFVPQLFINGCAGGARQRVPLWQQRDRETRRKNVARTRRRECGQSLARANRPSSIFDMASTPEAASSIFIKQILRTNRPQLDANQYVLTFGELPRHGGSLNSALSLWLSFTPKLLCHRHGGSPSWRQRPRGRAPVASIGMMACMRPSMTIRHARPPALLRR
jgi:hypothetical protein